MSATDLAKQSLNGLTTYRLRTFLTIFGIMWGIAAFIFSRAILDGFQYDQQQRFAALGKDVVVIYNGRTSLAGAGLMAGRDVQLTLDDVEVLAQSCQWIKNLSPELIRRNLPVESQREQITASVYGVWPVFQQLRSFEAAVGRLLNYADQQQARRVCFLGAELADQLLGEHPSVPSEIKIAGVPYRVVGTARKKPQGATLQGSDDRRLLLPLSSAARDFSSGLSNPRMITSIIVQPSATKYHEQLVREARIILARRHRFAVEDTDALGVFDTVETARDLDRVFSGMRHFGDLTAIITVLIGSIGVMNIMLISIRERTREIGVRRSIGARNRHIFLQFLSEGLLLTSLGGMLGMLLGCGLALLLRTIPIPDFAAPIVRPWPMLWACAIISLVGIAAALYPTWQAVKIRPVEALRYE